MHHGFGFSLKSLSSSDKNGKSGLQSPWEDSHSVKWCLSKLTKNLQWSFEVFLDISQVHCSDKGQGYYNDWENTAKIHTATI